MFKVVISSTYKAVDRTMMS